MEITNAKDIKTKRNKEFEEAVEWQMKNIQEAAEKGFKHTAFSVPYWFKEDIKALFEKQGYTFRPTGVIGGVMQDTIEICW